VSVRLELSAGTSEITAIDTDESRTNNSRWFRTKFKWQAAVCFALYVILSMGVYGHYGSLGPGHMPGFGSMDSMEQIWWLAWAAHAFPDVHSMLLGQGQNYPFGQNFGDNPSALALGVLFIPVTKLFGPVITWNILLRLALAVSAISMCLVLRRWTTWWPAAFLGGLIYGFCTYIDHLSTYPFLIFVPLPPLIFLLLHEILVRQQWKPLRTGILLGFVCILQYFISTEVLAGTLVMSSIAFVLLVLIKRRAMVEQWRYAATAFAGTLGLACVLLLYPTWFTFAGPEHIIGPPEEAAYWAAYLPVDLFSLIVPGPQWLHFSELAPAVQQASAGQMLYLGLPLVVSLICFGVFFRKNRAILFSGAMAMIAFVFSLGPRLRINGHETSITLPFVLFEHLPALDGFQTGRFALFTALFAAAMFAIGVDGLWKRLKQARALTRFSPKWSLVGRSVLLAVLACAVILPLVPNGARALYTTNVPTFFTSSAVDSIPQGSVVLTYPYPDQTGNNVFNLEIYLGLQPNDSVLLDQAVAGMRYNLIGGFGWFPVPAGRNGTTNPSLLRPESVQTLFDVALVGHETSAQRAILSNSNLTSDLRVFLRKYDVQTVIVYKHVGHSATVVTHLTAAIGPPAERDGVAVWFHVKQQLAAVG
jgi:hypothetical protein